MHEKLIAANLPARENSFKKLHRKKFHLLAFPSCFSDSVSRGKVINNSQAHFPFNKMVS